MVREAKALNRKSCKERRLENEQAEAQLRKCNKILKEHYLQRRELGQKLLNNRFVQFEVVPTMSKKLEAIMALNATTKPINTTSLDDLKQCHVFERKRFPIDFKPQNGGRVNRWRMKIPYKKAENTIDQETTESNASTSTKRIRKVQPPKIRRSSDGPAREYIQPDKLLSSNQTKNKFKNMWQIGK